MSSMWFKLRNWALSQMRLNTICLFIIYSEDEFNSHVRAPTSRQLVPRRNALTNLKDAASWQKSAPYCCSRDPSSHTDGQASWRNGSASDSRSEGCVFESRRGQVVFLFLFPISLMYFKWCFCFCFYFPFLLRILNYRLLEAEVYSRRQFSWMLEFCPLSGVMVLILGLQEDMIYSISKSLKADVFIIWPFKVRFFLVT